MGILCFEAGSHYAHQANFKLTDSLGPASWVLELQACTAIPGWSSFLQIWLLFNNRMENKFGHNLKLGSIPFAEFTVNHVLEYILLNSFVQALTIYWHCLRTTAPMAGSKADYSRLYFIQVSYKAQDLPLSNVASRPQDSHPSETQKCQQCLKK